MRKVSLPMLTPDMRLGRSVYYGRAVLIREGTDHLDRYVRKLGALGIQHLYIEDEACEGIEVEDIVSDTVRVRCKLSLEKTMEQIRSGFTVDYGMIKNTLETLLEEIFSHPDTLASLSEISNTDEGTFFHSINTTIYAVCLGHQLNYSTKQLMDLSEGLLLHDIGKTILDKEILFKPRTLTTEEFEYVKTHTTLGYSLLSKSYGLSELSRQIALSHHERLDGSGYPNGLIGKDIPEYSRISAIVDVYEALTSDRCYRKALSPYHAMEILMQEAASGLDLNLTSKFTQNIAVYPNGTTVYLSDGNSAIVKSQNVSMPLRPIVRVIGRENGKQIPLYEVDLMKVLNLTIVEPGCSIWRPKAGEGSGSVHNADSSGPVS